MHGKIGRPIGVEAGAGKIGMRHWKPGFECMDTPYELGLAHGKEDRSLGERFHYHTGCVMTPDEFNEYRSGYGDGWKSERGPKEF